MFTGVVIARRGIGAAETFTVRRIVAGEGVERTFPLHSPSVASIQTVRSGRVHWAKLHYLRDRVGKATRLAEVRRDVGTARKAKAEAEAAEAEAAEEAVEEAVEDVPADDADQEPVADEAQTDADAAEAPDEPQKDA